MESLQLALEKLWLLYIKGSKVFRAPMAYIGFAFTILLLLLPSACSSEQMSNESAINEIHSENKALEAQEVEDNIVNSYARLAAKRADICPKLLQKQVDNHIIKRSSEVMVNNHCDYFLYPRVGERIAVSLDNNQLEALLIVPTIHDFANGDYEVAAYDKHVIRLSYNGATYKPKRLSYDVSIKVVD